MHTFYVLSLALTVYLPAHTFGTNSIEFLMISVSYMRELQSEL